MELRMLSKNHNGAEDESLHVLEILGNAIVGGMEIYVRNLIHQLPNHRFRVTCLCPYESAYTTALRQMGCTVFTTPMHDDPPWRSIQLAVEIVRSEHIDLIHAHLPRAHVLAGLVGCLTQTPVVATVHGMTLTTQELGFSRTTGTHLITVCREAHLHALALGVPAERVTFIPNGVDINTFVPHISGQAFREQLGVSPEAPLVGFVGRLAWEKGPDQFIRAAAHVHRQRPEVHFALVGEGNMQDELLQMVIEMGLSECVHLAGLCSDTSQIYPAFDLVAQTSRVEGMPFALLEAMACGRPVVAINVGGVVELVEVGTSGLLLGPGDWEGVGNAIIDLLSRPMDLTEMGRMARQRVVQSFDLNQSVRLTADLFDRLANVKSSRRVNWLSKWPAVNGAR